MRISYVAPEDEAVQAQASYRYRILIPGSVLAKHHHVYVGGLVNDADVAMFSKHHLGTLELADQCSPPIVFDICNDHFERKQLKHIYEGMCERAAVLTCNSEAMAEAIKTRTGREATVIPDPYEHTEWVPAYKPHNPPRLCWFGHSSNKATLTDLPVPGAIEIVSNHVPESSDDTRITYTEFTRPAMVRAVRRADLVVIPTLPDRQTASANRVIETLRLGKFPVCGRLRAYEELEPYIWMGDDILEGIKWAYVQRAEVLERIRKGQDYIRERFSATTVAKRWEKVFTSTLDAATSSYRAGAMSTAEAATSPPM